MTAMEKMIGKFGLGLGTNKKDVKKNDDLTITDSKMDDLEKKMGKNSARITKQMK